MKYQVRSLLAASMVLMAALLGACSAGSLDATPLPTNGVVDDGRPRGGETTPPPADPNDPYGREMDQWIASSDSEFVKKVLSDHKITDSEFMEAQDRFEKCLNAAGIETTREAVSKAPSTVTQIATVGNADSNPALRECGSEWLDGIDMYLNILSNPKNIDFYELVQRCLVSSGVIPAETAVADVEDANLKAGIWNKDGKEYPPLDVNPTLPGGAHWLDQSVQRCFGDPLHPEEAEGNEP